MKKPLAIAFLLISFTTYSQKTVHVYVALCDNVHQGIVPVPKNLGNGQSPRTNLYWGALYGVKTHLKRSKDWTFIKKLPSKNPKILERVLFKHKKTDTYLLAEAYDGRYIKNTIQDFLESLAGNRKMEVIIDNQELSFAGKADLVSYIGHNGLMEFSAEGNFKNTFRNKKTPSFSPVLANLTSLRI